MVTGFLLVVMVMIGFAIAGAVYLGLTHRKPPTHAELQSTAILGSIRPTQSALPKDEAERMDARVRGRSEMLAAWIKWARGGTEPIRQMPPPPSSLDDLTALMNNQPPIDASVEDLQHHLHVLRAAINAGKTHRRAEELFDAHLKVAARITLLREDIFDPFAGCQNMHYLTHPNLELRDAYAQSGDKALEEIGKLVISAREAIRAVVTRQVQSRAQGETLKALVHDLAQTDPTAKWEELYNEPS